MEKMINILLFVMCLVTSSHTQTIDEIQSTLKEDLELDRQLKLINKLPVKSIHTKFGYIIDCIDIYKQPAFDHPLLKNHKLQRKPSFQQKKAKTSANDSPAKPKIGFEKVSCPTGTVPIRRTTKDDLIRTKSILNTQSLISHTAEVVFVPSQPYYAVSGTSSIYNPIVTKDQTSAAHLWVENGNGDGTNKIMVGWHVSPELHGDNATYTYILWTTDNFEKTGCYNLQCPGFVQTDNEIFIGERVNNTSIYGETTMIEMTISLYQDANTKHWWLNLENTTIGYFPAALFSNMAAAKQVGWGGKTTTPMGTHSPPMGSGKFPDEVYNHASYFSNVAFQNESRTYYGPEVYQIQELTDRPNCFGVKYYGDEGEDYGYALQFGGPGGICDN